ATGEFGNAIELNAVQRANPEMQKRVANAIRAMSESEKNPIVSIHDHGAGGHLNSLSELVEETGAIIKVNKLPVGDPTLSVKEILGNESQERMGLVIKKEHFEILERVAKRERSPIYNVGDVTKDNKLVFKTDAGECPIDLEMDYLFGKPPKTILIDDNIEPDFEELNYDINRFESYLTDVLQVEAVACKDWLTNKVDRSVSGKVAMQQCTGPVQLPLNNLGIMALDYQGKKGIATAIGHAPVSGLIDPEAGSRLAVAEALTNLIWAPLKGQLHGVSLSANWMWPAKNKGENARLYNAVKALSDFAIELGINVPTGKDSLSMTQKYPDGSVVYSPGTVIISAVGEVTDIRKSITPTLKRKAGTKIIYINFSNSTFELGGSSFAQTLNILGKKTANVSDSKYFARAFNTVQQLISEEKVLAGHDISAGGLVTTLLEMNFSNCDFGMDINMDCVEKHDIINSMFSENPGIVIQVDDEKAVTHLLKENNLSYCTLGTVIPEFIIKLKKGDKKYMLNTERLRDVWFGTSYMLDRVQSGEGHAHCRFKNYKRQDLGFQFKQGFSGKVSSYDIELSRRIKTGIKAAIIREKGVNGDREMAFALHLAGFDVKDIHMTDLIAGREDLTDVNMIVFVGGFSNSDVLGSAKGWAGAFLYNAKAKRALDNFYKREDTLSLGVCNGCQLMVELGLIYPKHPEHLKMLHNDSGKFESNFVNVEINETDSIMLKSLVGSRLGVWVAHGEGKFSFPYYRDKYNLAITYSYETYPGNPNGSDWSTAGICSNDGRHLAMMPHLERSFFPWQWPNY
ncbi:MAG: phosphoribosylformylglycinamidine synthase, partial [Bacteroidales bacterium]|nr:phosphoribosylformylglycinamidine synthase [Bacteroidales bacterium]